jgi:NADPH:quinone reductase-like Zn-dependent oxidoreductase
MPVPSEDEVLIKVEYSAYNRADTMQRKGMYPPPKGTTDVLGLECAGRLVIDPAQAGTDGEQLGGAVIALLPGGGYAQYAKVNKGHVLAVPDGVDLEQAAGITEVR